VPNYSISRNYKEMWNSTKISVTPGMHLTQGGRVQRPLTCGPSGWPTSKTPWSVNPTLQPPVSFLGGDTLQEVVEWNRGLESVEAALHGWPANTWRIIDLIKLVIALGTPINTPLPMEFRAPHSTCSSPLVKVPV
jgi:hypothetical protein